MKIDTLPLGYLGTNCYIVSDEETKCCVIVDPGGEVRKIEAFLIAADLTPAAICLTHGHFDHVLAVPSLKEQYQIPVYGAKADEAFCQHPETTGFGPLKSQIPFSFDHYVKEGELLTFGNMCFSVIETPGHTPGSVCYYAEKEKVLLSGDTLFKNSYGRTDFVGGNPEAMEYSLRRKLLLLPDAVQVYPGHMTSTTIGNEKRFNPICS